MESNPLEVQVVIEAMKTDENSLLFVLSIAAPAQPTELGQVF